MTYRRKLTRPPRQVEQSAAMIERDKLRIALALIKAELQLCRDELRISQYEAENLLHQKIRLAMELRDAKQLNDFLTGRSGLVEGRRIWRGLAGC